MNILFISKDLSGGDLAYRMKKEGHSVRFFVEDEDQQHNLDGLVEKTGDWKNDLPWVGKSGLIIFDDTGYGKIQDDLRSQGYSVIGGSEGGDNLENNRQQGQKILSLCGIETVPSVNFSNAKEAIKFVQENKGLWVVKQNNHVHKSFNYVGKMENGEDVIEVLKNYNRNDKKNCVSIELQEKVEGVEMGAARYFNGHDWVGPIEINFEYKNLCNGDLGPKTFEMGTLTWYDDNENNKLFQATLAKLKAYLQSVNFRGDIDVNCIINGDKAYPLEFTARFGWPSTHLHEEIHISPWGEFLKAVADGQPYDLKYKKGYGIVALVATPPFPYAFHSRKFYPEGMKIFFKKKPTKEELQHFHWEEVCKKKRSGEEEFHISSKTGFILHVTEMGKTVEEARKKTYDLMENLIIPKMFYRTDIGLRFIEKEQELLKKWGWI